MFWCEPLFVTIRNRPLAIQLLESAETIVLTLPALCEFVWVTTRAYGRGADEVAASLRRLIASPTARVDRPAVEAGAAFLEQGGDFAGGDDRREWLWRGDAGMS